MSTAPKSAESSTPKGSNSARSFMINPMTNFAGIGARGLLIPKISKGLEAWKPGGLKAWRLGGWKANITLYSQYPCFPACLLPSFPASQPPSFLAFQLHRFPASLPSSFIASQLPCFPASQPPSFLASQLPYFPAYLPSSALASSISIIGISSRISYINLH